MSNKNKVVDLKSYKKRKNKEKKSRNFNKNRPFVILFIVSVLILFVLNNFFSDPYKDAHIPESSNISYDLSKIQSLRPNEVIDKISNHNAQNKPVLLYLYTSWCSVCKAQLPVINEIARKYQNTDLKVVAVVIDRRANLQKASAILGILEKIYFEPIYLTYRGYFTKLLSEKSIDFGKRIPFTAIINGESKVISQFSGSKSLEFIEKRVKKTLFDKKNDN